MNSLKKLIDNNRQWAREIDERQPGFFRHLSQQQQPEYLWIGCADSRVPPNQVIGLPPGEVFVHRNIANVVVHTDFNCLSVVQYAVEVLQVRHIIVAGHYGCGGVAAALAAQERGESYGLIDNWLRHIRDVYRLHQAEIEALPRFEERCSRLCELNVVEQVANVAATAIVQQAWRRGQSLHVHGWIYNLDNGHLHDLNVSHSGPDI